MNRNSASAINYINSHNLIGIRAGKDREKFLDIWMVTVGERIFARSWGLAEKSWFNTFQKDPVGAIKCGEIIYPVEAKIPDDLSVINPKINDAYLAKYNSGANAEYAKGIIEDKHHSKTIELIILP